MSVKIQVIGGLQLYHDTDRIGAAGVGNNGPGKNGPGKNGPGK